MRLTLLSSHGVNSIRYVCAITKRKRWERYQKVIAIAGRSRAASGNANPVFKQWIIKAIGASKVFERQLVVTGAHLLEEQGHTIDFIIQDGFPIDEIVDCQLDLTSVESIAASMGRMGERLAHVFRKLTPDYVNR